MPRRKRQSFSESFRAEAVRLVLEENRISSIPQYKLSVRWGQGQVAPRGQPPCVTSPRVRDLHLFLPMYPGTSWGKISARYYAID